MIIISNFGLNVFMISNFPCEFLREAGYSSSPEEFKDFRKEVRDLNYKYLFGITANKIQEKAGTILKEEGFRKVVSFQSAHCNIKETLTLWVKIQKEAPDLSESPVDPLENYRYNNCSIAYLREDRREKNFCIFVENPSDSGKYLKKEGFHKVKNAPIWFSVAKVAEIRR